MTSSLLHLTDNIADGIHKVKCKHGNYNEKCGTCGTKYKDCGCFLKQINFKDYLILYKRLFCNI